MTARKARVVYATSEEHEFLALKRQLKAVSEVCDLERVSSPKLLSARLARGGEDLYLLDEPFFAALEQNGELEAYATSRSLLVLAEKKKETLSSVFAPDFCPRASFTPEVLSRILHYSMRERHLRDAVEYRPADQAQINKILTMFIELDAAEIDRGIHQALEACAQFAGVERCYLWQFSADKERVQKTHQWCAPGAGAQYPLGTIISSREMPWLVGSMQAGVPQAVHFTEKLPPEAEREREYFLSADIRSICIVPLLEKDEVVGFLGFSSVSRARTWAPSLVELLQTLGRIFVTALARKKAEEARGRSEQRFRSLVESLNDGLALLDASGEIGYVNRRFGELTGYSAAEIRGMRLAELLNDPCASTQPSSADSSARAERMQFQLVRRDGVKRWVEVSMTPYRAGSSATGGAVALLTDVTEQRELSAQLRQSQKMEAIGRLAGGVAHDFNNFLTAVLGYTGLLLHRLPDGHPNRRELLEIRKVGEQAASLVKQLLTVSRKQIIKPRVLSLNTVVEETGGMLKRLIGEHIELVIDLEPSLASVHADVGQMQQIVLNLAINARDAMPKGGTLKLSTRNCNLSVDTVAEAAVLPPGDYVVFSVEDTGCGISEEVKRHIFDPFFTTKEQGKGTGLGLSTVYSIVNGEGGHILLESEPGKGTLFEIFLPVTDAPLEQGENKESGQRLKRGRETILLVEDEQSVRALLTEVLRLSGYRVLVASDGPQALQLSRSYLSPIHLLITDLVMPGMGGHQVAEAICRARVETRALLISGYAKSGVSAGAVIRNRPWGFISKPFSPYDFSEKIRAVLDEEHPAVEEFSAGRHDVSEKLLLSGLSRKHMAAERTAEKVPRNNCSLVPAEKAR